MDDLLHLTRNPERGSTDRALLDALLDDVLVATVCAVHDGRPWCLPLLFARDGGRVLVHGSTGAGLLRHLADGAEAALTVSSVDALVVAETAFESSANYRSAVVQGSFSVVPDDERDAALRALTDRILPGRTSEVPARTRRELAATVVLALEIREGGWSYKARSGPSGRPDPLVADTWVGVVPLQVTAGTPVRDEWVSPDVPVPPSVRAVVERHAGPGR